MKKPYIICHMMSTVDGRIIAENWGAEDRIETFSGIYEKCHETFDSQAWMVGRVTMEKDFTEGHQPQLTNVPQPIVREPFIGDKSATAFAIAVDAKGKLGWQQNHIEGDHIIEILTESVSDAYLQYLQQTGISYIFAGKNQLDFTSALNQLAELFPIQTILLEGGGHINGSVLNEGLIDELSLLIIPIADGTPNTATPFDVSAYLNKKLATPMRLTHVERLEDDVLWLKYQINNP